MIHLIHGIHTQGPSPVRGLIYYLNFAGLAVKYPDYGWIAGLETKVANPIICGTLQPYIAPEDILIGHSNGCAVAYDLLKRGVKVAGAVFINAALERNIARLAPWVDVYFNPGDEITEVAQLGERIGVVDSSWGEMGHAGYLGGDPLIASINCGSTIGMPAVSGHSDFFTPGKLAAWAPYLINRIKAHLAQSLTMEVHA
jgi:pimeloyl-ACP methyl ester carboxylesterase